MSLEENGNGIPATMLVGPTGYNNGGNTGFGDGNGWWIILLFILMLMGGWNRGGYGGGDCGPGNGYGYVQQGFDQASVMNGITGIQNGVNALGMQVCNGFGQAEIAANARQMADMNQAFAAQTAMDQGFNSLQAQLAQCCCENRLGTADLKYTVATENCADRTQSMQNTRDIIDAINNRAQGIENKLCQLELDGVKGERDAERRANAELREQVTRLTLGNQLATGFANEVDALYNRLNSCPVPSTPVFGRTPIFTCAQNPQYSGCGCGGNNLVM